MPWQISCPHRLTALATPNTQLKKPIYDDPDAVPTTTTLPPPSPTDDRVPAPPNNTNHARDEYEHQLYLLEQQNKARLQAMRQEQQAREQQQQQQHGPTPTDRLAQQIRGARLFLYRQCCAAEDAVNRTVTRAFRLEKAFTDTVAGLAPPAESGEKLMPGLVYVLVAAMAGSIVTRRSNILLRATVPATFGVAMGWTAIPVTMTNVADLAWRYEQRFPAVAEGHLRTRVAWRDSVSFARAHAQVGRQMVDDKVRTARETVEDWVSKGK